MVWAAALVAALMVAAGTAGAQQPLMVYGNVAQLCAATGLEAGAQVRLEGYRAPGDGGGGLFKYDPVSEAKADGGSVLQPATLPGRLLRIADPDEDAYAEWFGAWGDGDSATPHDDQAAINACLAAYGRVRLQAKVYGVRGKPEPYNPAITYHAIDLGPYYKVQGAGRKLTTVKLLDGTNPHGNNQGDNYFILLSNRAFHESAEHVVISDLTLDCNFDAQDKVSTIHAIGIRGGGALVERLNLRGYGTGRDPVTGNSRECFVIHQTLVYKDTVSCRRAAILRDLDFTDPGHNGMLEGTVGEITHIALGGADNFENKGWILPQGADPAFDPSNEGENEANWWPSYGGLVESCVIHDEGFDPPTQKSPLNGITVGDSIGVVVQGNRVVNFEGTAFFTMSWWHRNTTVVDNEFTNVTSGLALCLQSDGKLPIQCPRHEDFLFAHNTVVTGDDPDAPWGTCAINLYGGEMPQVTRMKGIHIRGNRLAGRAYNGAKGERACPLAIKIQILRAVYDDIRIEDNVVDFPDFPDAVWVPKEPWEAALMFYPRALWDSASASGAVRFRNNRTPQGKLLYPFLVDWYFDSAPTWGRP